jgi:hypothetical protein
VIRGVALFPDHQDQLQWYFMPSAPRLSLIPDATTNQPRPALQLIKFRGDAGNGGFLNFDVNIGIDDGVLDDVKSELRSEFKLPPGAIKISPVPLVGGTVKLLILGQESPAPKPASGGSAGSGGSSAGAGAAPATTQPVADNLPKFVTRISHEAHPSLYGDNQAAFSVALDQYGVTVLQQALAGNMAPIAVVYSLDYLGLRPAYTVHLNIDWDRVQKHMDEHFGVDTLFTSINIDNAVDELVENRAIVLEADTFVPEGEDDTSVISSRDRALNECRDMITDAFFTPSVDPVKPRSDDWDKATRTAARVGTIIATGGWAGVGTFSYSKNNYKRVDKKILDVNMSERTTVQRSIYPQGHLTGLFQVLRDQHLNMSDFVTSVNLNDPWFQRRKVTVISRANFDGDSIGSLNVKLSYGSEPKNVILEKQNSRQDLSWLSQLKNGAMDLPVTYQYRVSFTGVDGTTRPIELDSASDVVTTENLEIEPRMLYSIVPIPVAVSNPATFPWTRFPRIEVHCQYVDDANKIRQQDIHFLEKDKADKTWNLFVRNPDLGFQYKLIYRAANNEDYETDWRVSTTREVMVKDPFPSKRTVLVAGPANWAALDQVFVDVAYEDKANQFTQEDSFQFSESDHANKTFTVDLRDPAQRRVSFAVTFMGKNGDVFEIPRSYTLDNRILVRPDMRGHRIVAIRAPKVNFAGKKVRQLDIALRYKDGDASLQYAGQASLKSSTDQGTFEFDYVDPQKSGYEYQLSVSFLNGMTQDFDWKPADGDDLLVEL